MMTDGKYYSVKDLANLTGEDKSTTAEIVRFLAKYGFIEQAGSDDSVFTKSKIIISPAKSIELLKTLVQSAI
jgi:DNA-binding IclR family transcriptional regulator